MSKQVKASEIGPLIPDGAFVASAGVIGWITPDAVLREIGEHFARTGKPRDLTFYFPCGVGDAMGIKGMDHVAREGLMKRVISGSYINAVDPKTGKRPRLMRLIRENRVEAYSWPIGASMHWLREVARKSPGYITRVGLGTYIDPRLEGGKLTGRASEGLVRVIDLEGEEFLFYPSRPIDVAIIRASSADRHGNLSWEDEPLISASTALALAAKASGGRVIAQVRRMVEDDVRTAVDNRLPGHMVDHVLVDGDMKMATDVDYEPAYFSGRRMSLGDLPTQHVSIDTIVASRIIDEVRPGELTIYGFGAASDVPLLMARRGIFDEGGLQDYPATTEHGSYGGIVMPGWQFSANINPVALLDGLAQFDAIDGGLCQFAALSFAEFDADGCVNVSRFGTATPGAGGFIDIAQCTPRLVFAGTFTTGGLDAEYRDGKLVINREGRIRKFVSRVTSLTYRARVGVQSGRVAKVITERAVFEVREDGLCLVEIAPGIDLQRQVLDQMEFSVRVADHLRIMEERHFSELPVASAPASTLDVQR